MDTLESLTKELKGVTSKALRRSKRQTWNKATPFKDRSSLASSLFGLRVSAWYLTMYGWSPDRIGGAYVGSYWLTTRGSIMVCIKHSGLRTHFWSRDQLDYKVSLTETSLEHVASKIDFLRALIKTIDGLFPDAR